MHGVDGDGIVIDVGGGDTENDRGTAAGIGGSDTKNDSGAAGCSKGRRYGQRGWNCCLCRGRTVFFMTNR